MARQSALRALRAAQLATRRAAAGGGGGGGGVSSSTTINSRLLFDIRASAHLLGSVSASSGVPSASVPSSWRSAVSVASLQPSDVFAPRHNSTTPQEEAEMVAASGFASLDALIDATVPASIRRKDGMPLPGAHGQDGQPESVFLEQFKAMASKNRADVKCFLGMGYYGTHLPPVIQRNVLENPGWYTQYTPYQAEIAQGRLESLLTFQTMITELTGMQISNASLLDEATAAAEAMTMCSAVARGKKPVFLVSSLCHPQTIAVCKTRAEGLGLKAEVVDELDRSALAARFGKDVCGILLQYPATDGSVCDYRDVVGKAHAAGLKVVVSTDLLALTKLAPPSEFGADIVVGSAQRFGVPMGYGGPHAAFLACHEDFKRMMPGRIIGVSVDAQGKPALRMAMQTREQHIRRDKATSNICTAQALLANIAALYGCYHGPKGLLAIADRVHGLASVFAEGAAKAPGCSVAKGAAFFDTVAVAVPDADKAVASALTLGANIRKLSSTHVSASFDETSSVADVDLLLKALHGGKAPPQSAEQLAASAPASRLPAQLARKGSFMEQEVFNSYHAEHEMLRYLKRLENKDLSLAHSMIPLGSCTMKLNATSEMMPITWPELCSLHPYVPVDQAQGYAAMFEDLSEQLASITGFDAVSLQPNSGASGEYAGLMAIRAYHRSRNEPHRDVCIIPVSAHGTNPASAVMAGMKIVTVSTDAKGNVNMAELKEKAAKAGNNLAALMITYPSTYGVYEEGVDEVCRVIHSHGGQVYMDGANMNAQVGLTAPGLIGADVCHLNLHKTFCIPHGGGGPGMGPIGVKAHLAPFMPSHPIIPTGALPKSASCVKDQKAEPFGAMAAAPFGSSLILPISYAYIAMMGSKALTEASRLAILKANYMAARLAPHFPILYTGPKGTVAHEFILDVRPLEGTAGVKAEDIAKRLIDYGFHAPTMSWPVPGTLMVEPTESETKAELDRFCDAMISIRREVADIEQGRMPRDDNPLVHAPHAPCVVLADKWERPYSREVAAFPAPWVRAAKFWPTTSRLDNVFGDRKLIAKLPKRGGIAAALEAAGGVGGEKAEPVAATA